MKLDQSFLEAPARRVANVLTERRDIDISGRSIKTDCFGLAGPSFKPQRNVSTCTCVGLESIQDPAGDTLPAPRWLHEHSFDFSNGRFQFTNRATTNRPTISVGNEKSQPPIPDVFWTKTVKGDAGIPAMQVLIEGPNENKGIL
jgi:hypothetical protein